MIEANNNHQDLRMDIEATETRKKDGFEVFSDENIEDDTFPKEKVYQMHYPRQDPFGISEESNGREWSRKDKGAIRKGEC